ncbi:MAG: ABC transporter permease subunit [Woeseiaceae bacterium]|nr:ABC transporter permease subunit [Woeseiaceae bacterium]
MNGQGIAVRWYVPAEIQVLRVWLPVAALINAFIVGAEVLRAREHGMLLSVAGLAALLLLRALLPDGRLPWKRTAALALAAAGVLAGLWSLFAIELSFFNFWSNTWLVFPAGIALYWLSVGPAASWASGASDSAAAESGLARNKQVLPRLESFGLHTLLLHAIAVVIVPVIWIIDISFSPGNVLGGAIGDAFTLEHYESMLGGSQFWLWTRNSVIVAIGTTIVGLLLAIPAGYAFSRYDFAGRKGSMFVFMLVQMFPGAIILVPYFMVMKTLGLLNTSIGLIIAYSVTALPLCVWMLKGFFDSVPRALEEAALLDGCTQVEVFYRIVLPLSLPAVAMTALFSFLAAWNEFVLALVFNTSNESYTLPVGLASLIPTVGQQWGDFAAASVVVSIPVVIMFIAFQRALIQGLSAGAVKG